MVGYGIVVFALYVGMAIYILPTMGVSFDLYERKFRLLPHGFKYVAIAWLVIAFILILVFRHSFPEWDELLLSNFNIAIFMLFFSKRKNEDEFSEQLRFKAFTYSFVSFVALFGAVGAMNIIDTDGSWSNFIIHGFIGSAMLVATLYFYFTVYKLRKENN
jgi:hypothetical protein